MLKLVVIAISVLKCPFASLTQTSQFHPLELTLCVLGDERKGVLILRVARM